MTETIQKITAAASNGLTRAEVIATVLNGREMTPAEQTAFDRARGVWKLREAKRKAEKHKHGPQTDAERKDKYRARKYDISGEIAELQDKVNHKRRKRALSCLYEFLRAYCPGSICDYPPPPEMKELIDDMERCAKSNARYQIEMSRGFGKTTYVSALGPYMVLIGASHFVEIIASTDASAKTILDKMVAVFEGEKFREDFPEIAVPFKRADHNTLRMMHLNYGGVPLDMEQTADHLILPRIGGNVWNNAKFIIRGFTSSNLRGINLMGKRPDLIVLDDIQTDKMAINPKSIIEAMAKINGTIRGQFSHAKGGTMLMTSTPYRAGDLTCKIKEDAAWITKVYPMMISMPTNRELWEKYAEVLHAEKEALAKNEKPEITANAFYKANRAALDEGAVCHSPHAFEHRTEVSAVQHAMNIIIRDGVEHFSTEYQMKPIRSTSVYDFTADDVIRATNNTPTGRVPAGFDRAIATIDVMSGAGLRYTLVAFGTDRKVAVFGYGRYPADGRPLFDRNDPPDVKDTAVARAVSVLLREFRSARFPTEDGRTLPISKVGIDVGWKDRIVHPIADTFGDWVTCMRGQPFSAFNPYGKFGRPRPDVGTVGEFCYSFRGQYGLVLFMHSDHWTEEAQLAWKLPVFAPGSLSVGRGNGLLEFAQECAADSLIEKDVTAANRETWKWATEGPNHFGDCVKMALALGSWFRVYTSTDHKTDALSYAGIEPPPRPAPRPPRPRVACI